MTKNFKRRKSGVKKKKALERKHWKSKYIYSFSSHTIWKNVMKLKPVFENKHGMEIKKGNV